MHQRSSLGHRKSVTHSSYVIAKVNAVPLCIVTFASLELLAIFARSALFDCRLSILELEHLMALSL